MQINPYLTFDGKCREAFEFYEKVLEGKISFITTFGESPVAAEMPSEYQNLVMHATLNIGDGCLMGSDAPPDRFEQPQGIHVSLHFKDVAQGERVFKALSESGQIQMPFQPTFWAAGFGMCVDRFGIPWMVNCEQSE